MDKDPPFGSYEWHVEQNRKGAEILGWVIVIIAPFWLAWQLLRLLGWLIRHPKVSLPLVGVAIAILLLSAAGN